MQTYPVPNMSCSSYTFIIHNPHFAALLWRCIWDKKSVDSNRRRHFNFWHTFYNISIGRNLESHAEIPKTVPSFVLTSGATYIACTSVCLRHTSINIPHFTGAPAKDGFANTSTPEVRSNARRSDPNRSHPCVETSRVTKKNMRHFTLKLNKGKISGGHTSWQANMTKTKTSGQNDRNIFLPPLYFQGKKTTWPRSAKCQWTVSWPSFPQQRQI